MKLFHAFAIGLTLAGVWLLSACATDPGVRWAQAQSAYDDARTTIVDYRRPCVPGQGVENAGPNHPRCLIDGDAMRKLSIVNKSASILLSDMEIQSRHGASPDYGALMLKFEPLLEEILLAIIEAEARRDVGS